MTELEKRLSARWTLSQEPRELLDPRRLAAGPSVGGKPGEVLQALSRCVRGGDSRRSSNDVSVRAIAVERPRLIAILSRLESLKVLESVVDAGLRCGWIVGGRSGLSLVVSTGSGSTSVPIGDEIEAAWAALKRKEVGEAMPEWSVPGSPALWARIGARGQGGSLLVLQEAPRPGEAVADRLARFLRRLPRIPASDILGDHSAFAPVGEPVLTLGGRYQALRPIDADTRARLLHAASARGVAAREPLILAPVAAVRLSTVETAAPGLSRDEAAWRLVSGAPLDGPAPAPRPEGRVIVGEPGRVRRDLLASPTQIATAVARVPAPERRKPRSDGRTRRTHTTLAQPTRRRVLSGRSPQEGGGSEDGVQRRLSGGQDPRRSGIQRVSLMGEGVLSELERRIADGRARDEEADRDRTS